MYYGNKIINGKTVKDEKNTLIKLTKFEYIAQNIIFSILLSKDIKNAFINFYYTNKNLFEENLYSIVFNSIKHIEKIILKNVFLIDVVDDVLFLKVVIIYENKTYELKVSSFL